MFTTQQRNYSFFNTNTVKDKVPEWLDNFVSNYTEKDDQEQMQKIASVFNIEAKEHHCNCCGNELEDDEVKFCKSCIKDSLS